MEADEDIIILDNIESNGKGVVEYKGNVHALEW